MDGSREGPGPGSGPTEDRAAQARDRPVYVEEPPQEVSLYKLAAVLLGGWRWLVLAPVIFVVVLVAVVYLMPAQYSSTTSFTPSASGRQQAGQLSDLASQFGISVPIGGESESPQFYADLLRTRDLLRATVTSDYQVESEGAGPPDVSMTLVEKFGVQGGTRSLGTDKAIRRLDGQIDVATSSETGIVTLTVTLEDPEWARAVADRMIELVNRFNVERRQTQASAKREFLADRVDSARAELRAAERQLANFLSNNRNYQNSPALMFEHNKLERRVTLRQQVYSSLAQSFEQARIEEVRNTPVVTVVDKAEVPARPDRPATMVLLVAGTLGGLLIAVVWVLSMYFIREGRRRNPEEYAAYREKLRGMKQELRSISNRIRQAWKQG